MIPQLFLITPKIADWSAFRPALEAVLATGALSVILLRVESGNEAEAKRMLLEAREMVQEAGVAALMDCPDDPRFIARLGMDGAHLTAPGDKLGDVITALKPDRIIGVGGIKSRHDAMEAGERDIDYVMFGEPRADGSLPLLTQTLERASWWAEIFTLPCVAYAADGAAVPALAATGADFIALGPWLFEAANPAQALSDMRRMAKEAALARQEALG
jgi:thiamine-phosphate pyrophosphorylase